MSFEAESKAEILKRLQKNLQETENGQSIVEGTFNSDMLAANAIEFEQSSAEMNMIVEAAFARTSWGEYLSMKAEEYGVVRKAATTAIGKIIVSGKARARIIKGSLFATAGGIKFYTTEDAEVGTDGTVEISVIAGSAGTSGNVGAGTINQIPMSIPNIASVSNTAATYNGFEEENDAELLQRYLLKVRTPATSGNKYHYQQWALSVDGVGQCKVLPLWNGPGTVKIIIINSNNATASQETIDAVAGYIETVRPIGATVTVTSPTPLAVNITADIEGTADTEAIKKAVNTYFKAGGFDMKKVTMAQIGRILMNLGTITDYDNLELNGAAKSVIVGADQLAACGEVVLNVVTE